MAFHVGVLGAGAWCPVHLEAFTQSSLVTQVTLAARNTTSLTARAAQFPIVTGTTTDHELLLNDPSVDLIDIILPHDLHASHVIDALDAGKHVICEKPAGTNLADFDTMVKAARTSKRMLLVVMNQLYDPIIWKIRELVDTGAVGRPFLCVENSYSNARENYVELDYWRNRVDRAGGGVLIDGGYHMVYRHLYVLASHGSPQWVTADAPQLGVSDDGTVVQAKGEDTVSISVGYEKSLRILWSHAWSLVAGIHRARQCFLAGTEGTLELTDQPNQPILLHRPDGSQSAVTVPERLKTREQTTQECLQDFLKCIAADNEPQIATLALARLTLATVLAAYESSQTGQRCTIG